MSSTDLATLLVALSLAALVSSCSEDDARGSACEGWSVSDDAAWDEQFLGMPAAEQFAVVDLSGTVDGTYVHCSGTVVSASLVLSAKHCSAVAGADDSMVVAESATASVTGAFPHDSLDVMLLSVVWDGHAPTPLAITDDAIDRQWLGRLAVAAGYGRTDRFVAGHRHFSVQQISDVDGERLEVSALAAFGVCAGDSGGPLLVRGESGGVQVAGVLSTSSSNCASLGYYTRSDILQEWLVAHEIDLGATHASECGALTNTGFCDADRAVWCDDRAQTETCPDRCGWSDVGSGFRCLEGSDPCDGLGLGECDGTVARRCVGGSVESVECRECGAACVIDPGTGRAGCVQQ